VTPEESDRNNKRERHQRQSAGSSHEVRSFDLLAHCRLDKIRGPHAIAKNVRHASGLRNRPAVRHVSALAFRTAHEAEERRAEILSIYGSSSGSAHGCVRARASLRDR
jgi:hypothetical protein